MAKMTYEEKEARKAERERQAEVARQAIERERRITRFTKLFAKAHTALVVHANGSGWLSERDLTKEQRELPDIDRTIGYLSDLVYKAFDARQDFLRAAERIVSRANENLTMMQQAAAANQPLRVWNEMGRCAAEFDTAKAVYEERWKAATMGAAIANIIVPELHDYHAVRQAALMAITITSEQTADGTRWLVRHCPEGNTVDMVNTFDSRDEAYLSASFIYERLSGTTL